MLPAPCDPIRPHAQERAKDTRLPRDTTNHLAAKVLAKRFASGKSCRTLRRQRPEKNDETGPDSLPARSLAPFYQTLLLLRFRIRIGSRRRLRRAVDRIRRLRRRG